jgi:hypothetical protein
MSLSERMLRCQAESLGLRVNRRGNVFELHNDEGLVLSGLTNRPMACGLRYDPSTGTWQTKGDE